MASQPYGAFRQLIRRTSGAADGDSTGEIRVKIASSCTVPTMPSGQRQRSTRAFETLLGVQEARDPNAAPLEGEAFKNELFQSMLATWRAWAQTAPVVLVFDDLHWADPASIELLLHLFQLADEVPILFLCAFRPDRDAPAWQLKQAAETDWSHRYTGILLGPLSLNESDVLVNSLLAVADLPPALRQLILHKAEGNPFFVEEVIRELIEQGIVVRDQAGLRWHTVKPLEELQLSIPDNLQALIAARIDRLEEETRHTLQLAAVIGRTFFYRVLQRVDDMATELDWQLRSLQRAELIREQAREPELEYAFRHALTQEAAYDSILLKRRRVFHRHVGEVIEELFADRKEEYASQLAHHFYEAHDARALEYTILAGDTAFRLYANAEAVRQYSRTLEVAGWNPRRAPDLLHVYGRRGRALELNARYQEALDNYCDMERVGREGNRRDLELAAVTRRAVLLATPTPVYNPSEARALCDQALELAREIGDHRAAVRILWIMMLLYHHEGELEKSIANGEQALLIARQLDLREELASVVNDLVIVYESIGDLDRARAAGQEAHALWQELGNQPMLLDSLGGAAGTEVLAGNFDRAIQLAEEADQLGQEIGNLWGQAYSRMYIAYVYERRGEFSRALEIMEACLRLSKAAGFMAPFGVTRADMGFIYARLGWVDRGLDLLLEALSSTADRTGPWQTWVMSQLARVQILSGHPGAAEAVLRDAASAGGSDPGLLYTLPLHLARLALTVARSDFAGALKLIDEQPIYARIFPIFVPEVLYLKGLALLGLGRTEAARRVLNQARHEARAMGSRRLVWPILVTLSEIEERRGHAARAHTLLCEARSIVQYIAEHIDQAELRASFLGLPQVQAVLARPALALTPRDA
jgi:tetratricopeptide (TPR) repeat protein